ncbi:two component response regulator [Sulfurimonas gotlandica GD1]|uniref:Two component response regulator n=1 Tax=Sulfurimonas gotlandica (strain DSM 19862 / JCM 16533 / GD1) TaxID=929558 RepID=B6BL19_SULGG|nr:response regulator [Sulfurimonas gotlandica]EDZ62124.1 diguanylate cyclase domain protein [Sulfurimonas gotlandica GD1]EHP28751.1 two component response regulator [Sulfurimonas gotlandica GD1]
MITKKIENVKNIVRNYNVLIVEDDSFIREQLSRILKKLFKEIYIAVDGKDGLSKYKENKNNIHIIITDLNMPHIGGLQMIEYIKEIDKDIPILILSAHSESHFFMKSIRLGVDGYLQKPLDSDLLMDLIKKVVLKKKLQDDLLESTNFLNQYKEAADESAVVSKT